MPNEPIINPTPQVACYVIHETQADAFYSPIAVNAEHGLILVLDGWFTIEQKFQTRATQGSVTIVPSGIPYRPIDGEKLHYWLLGFTAASFGLDESQAIMRMFAGVRLGASPLITLQSDAQQRLIHFLEQLDTELHQNSDISYEIQRSLIVLILAEIERALPVQRDHVVASTVVSQALRFIQLNCLSPISLDDVADAVNRSKSHVATAVKKQTGFTVGVWIASARLAKATQLLEHTDLAIDQIAPQIGWQDTTHFIRQFRKIYGATPAAWRKRRRNTPI